jgi:DNA-binding NtrC family response regulator
LRPFQDLTQVEQLRKELESRYTFEEIIGHNTGHDNPLGAVHPIDVDVRVVAAANQDLETLVRDKKFRKNLLSGP